MQFIVDPNDVVNASGNTNPTLNGVVFWEYTDCNGVFVQQQYGSAGSHNECLCTNISSYYWQNDAQQATTYSPSYVGPCGVTPTPTPTSLVCYIWTNLDSSEAFYDWIDCDGTVHTNEGIIVEGSICAQDGSVVYVSGGLLTQGGSCTPLFTQTPTPTPTQTPSVMTLHQD